MKRFLYISWSILMLVMTACNKNTDSNQANRSLAQLKSFYFVANDSIPGLAKAVFSIEERNDTGLVWNKDSMLYGTNLTRVVPRFTFAATPDAAFLTMHDTIHVLTGYDTLDFTKKPIYLTIRSADKSNTKIYEIRATVHQSDPDLYTWEQLSDGVYPQDDSEQRVVELGTNFIMLTYNGFAFRAFESADGSNWTDKGTMTGLPAGTKMRHIVSDGTTLYYGQDNSVYTRSDAINWTSYSAAYPIYTTLLYWNSKVWMLIENNGYQLATWENNQLDTTSLRPSERFPISDFATVCFQSSSLRERAMIIGGFDSIGTSLNTRWNFEYSRHIPQDNGYRLQEFSSDRSSFSSLTGISVIYYNHQLQLFGGVDGKMSYLGRDILISSDEGINWVKADTAKNQLPAVYQARQKQTAIVRDNYIYLFGGEDANATYSDVYRGRLNSIDWKK